MIEKILGTAILGGIIVAVIQNGCEGKVKSTFRYIFIICLLTFITSVIYLIIQSNKPNFFNILFTSSLFLFICSGTGSAIAVYSAWNDWYIEVSKITENIIKYTFFSSAVVLTICCFIGIWTKF